MSLLARIAGRLALVYALPIAWAVFSFEGAMLVSLHAVAAIAILASFVGAWDRSGSKRGEPTLADRVYEWGRP